MLKVRKPPHVIPVVDWHPFAICRVLQKQLSRVKSSSHFFLKGATYGSPAFEAAKVKSWKKSDEAHRQTNYLLSFNPK
jgi:hypothetical protein